MFQAPLPALYHNKNWSFVPEPGFLSLPADVRQYFTIPSVTVYVPKHHSWGISSNENQKQWNILSEEMAHD